MYLNVNSSLNTMPITVTIHRSPINVSEGMNEMTCWKMPWASSRGRMWAANTKYKTVESATMKLTFPPHTWSITLSKKNFLKWLESTLLKVILVLWLQHASQWQTLLCVQEKRARVAQSTPVQTVILWLLDLQILPFVSSHLAQAASAASFGAQWSAHVISAPILTSKLQRKLACFYQIRNSSFQQHWFHTQIIRLLQLLCVATCMLFKC